MISGIARAAEEISTRLQSFGHCVDIVSSNDIPRIELGELRLSSMLWKGLDRVLRRLHEYDIVHIHGPVPSFSDVALLFAALARRRSGPRIVYTHHCEIELPGKEVVCAPYNFMHRTLARLADHVVVYTPSYAESFTPFVAPEKISVIPGAGNEHDPVTSKPDGFNVLFVGQLRPYKGLEVLLRAAAHLGGVKLTIIGTGHREAHYRELAEELDLQNTHFLGKASEEVVDAAYAEAHVLVLPSLTRAEAFGLVLLEGMAAGCVPVASHLPGVKDVVGSVGATFEPGNADQLAEVLRSLQQNRGALQQLSAAARHWAAQFSWDMTARGYDQLFTALARGETPAALNWFPQPASSLHAMHMPVAPRKARAHIITPSLAGLTQSVRTMFELVTQQFGPSSASLLLKLPAEESLVISAHMGLNDVLLGSRVALRGSVAGWVASEDRPTIIDAQHAPREIREFLRRPDLSSALSVPVHFQDQVAGVLNLARRAHQLPYTQDDLHELVAFISSWEYFNANSSQPMLTA